MNLTIDVNEETLEVNNSKKLVWSDLSKLGIIDDNTEIFDHPKFEKIINIEYMNKFLFGSKDGFELISDIDIISRDFAIRYKDKMFLLFSKINQYFEYLFHFKDQISASEKLIPFNYFNLLQYKFNYQSECNKNKNKIKIDLIFLEFYIYLRRINTNESKLISNCIFNDSHIFQGIFKGHYVTEPINSKGMFLGTVAFSDYNKNTFYISISNGFEGKSKTSLNINTDFIPQFDKIYDNIKKQILFRDIRSYTINNLNNVIGNYKISTMIYDSKADEDNYIINVKDIETLLPFNENYMDNRLAFLEEHKDDKNYEIKYDNGNEIVFLNFNGLQDFLLSVDKKCLLSESFIKDIRKFYKDIMKAFIEILEERYSELK